MSYNEANMQTSFTAYCKKPSNGIKTAAFELKITKTPSLAFSRVEEHQRTGLLRASGDDGSFKKLTDLSIDSKPYDAYMLKGEKAYVVIMFYKPRKPKVVYLIEIHDFLECEETYDRKSMTEEIARQYCEFEILL